MWIAHWRLEEGSRGPQVAGLQERLGALGFATPKNGEFGPNTAEAVRGWQKQRGLLATGIVEPEDFRTLWQSTGQDFQLGTAQPLVEGSFTESYLVVSLQKYRLFLYNHQQLVKSYLVSIGKSATPTPQGNFRFLELWHTTGSSLGSRYLSFSPYRHSIHGLPPGERAGEATTLGCLQLQKEDLEEICTYIQVGTPLVIGQEHLPPPQECQWLFYYPQKGEGIEEICLRYGVGLSQLLSANGLSRKEELVAGRKLRIPSGKLFQPGGPGDDGDDQFLPNNGSM